jgi:hypothetical protein
LLPVHILTGARDPLASYRYGGSFLPAPVFLISALLVAFTVASSVLWRIRQRRRAVWLGVVGLLLTLATVANHWAGLVTQADAAVGILDRLGLTEVHRAEMPDMGHDPAPDPVFSIIARSLEQHTAPER